MRDDSVVAVTLDEPMLRHLFGIDVVVAERLDEAADERPVSRAPVVGSPVNDAADQIRSDDGHDNSCSDDPPEVIGRGALLDVDQVHHRPDGEPTESHQGHHVDGELKPRVTARSLLLPPQPCSMVCRVHWARHVEAPL